jgi:hypothetical protein
MTPLEFFPSFVPAERRFELKERHHAQKKRCIEVRRMWVAYRGRDGAKPSGAAGGQ